MVNCIAIGANIGTPCLWDTCLHEHALVCGSNSITAFVNIDFCQRWLRNQPLPAMHQDVESKLQTLCFKASFHAYWHATKIHRAGTRETQLFLCYGKKVLGQPISKQCIIVYPSGWRRWFRSAMQNAVFLYKECQVSSSQETRNNMGQYGIHWLAQYLWCCHLEHSMHICKALPSWSSAQE